MKLNFRSTLTYVTVFTSALLTLSIVTATVKQDNIGEAQAEIVIMEVASVNRPLVADLTVLSAPEEAVAEVELPEVELPESSNIVAQTTVHVGRASRLNTGEPTRGVIRSERTSSIKSDSGFNFPSEVSKEAQDYLIEVHRQAYEASKHTEFPDPFMAMSLGVVENPVSNHEVFRLPLVRESVLNSTLQVGTYADAIPKSTVGVGYNNYSCEGPLQIAVGWVASKHLNPTIWQEAATMFYEDATLAIPGMTAFAEKCGIEVDQEFLMTIASMRHNVGNLSDWSKADPNSSPNKKFIPFKTKRAVYEWNEAVASEPAQEAIKRAAYDSYQTYIATGIYDNQGIGWEKIADITGYPRSNVTGGEWWRPLFNVRFWYNYYLLQLLYGVETPASLGI